MKRGDDDLLPWWAWALLATAATLAGLVVLWTGAA